VIKEFLTERLPDLLSPPTRPRKRQRGGTRITLLCAVIILLSGWFEAPLALVLILLVPSVVLAFYQFCGEVWNARRIERLVFLAFGVVVAGLLLLAWWNGVNGFLVGVIAAAVGYWAMAWFEENDPAPARRGREETLQIINEVVRAPTDPELGTDAVKFRPSFPAETADQATIWAIDPVRRVLRVMARANAEIDELVEWDEPIHAVTLKRVELSRWWPSTESRMRAIRRDRDLEVVCGRDEAAKWRYVFEFAGPDMAERWRDVFESWMIKDQERMSV
jgi:hypothetical protein